jgi:hypothetical protein
VAGFRVHTIDFIRTIQTQFFRSAQEYRIQRSNSGSVARLPYIRMPTR